MPIIVAYIFVAFFISIFCAASRGQELSPFGTGFALGTTEDREIRIEWAKKDPNFKHGFSENSTEEIIIRLERAKKDPCFKHGFSEFSIEGREIKKAWAIKNGPNAAPLKCPR